MRANSINKTLYNIYDGCLCGDELLPIVRTQQQVLLLKLRVGIKHMACFYSYDLGDRILFEIVILTDAAAEACGSWRQLLQHAAHGSFATGLPHRRKRVQWCSADSFTRVE